MASRSTMERHSTKGVDRVIIPAFLYLADTVATLAAFGDTVIAPSNATA